MLTAEEQNKQDKLENAKRWSLEKAILTSHASINDTDSILAAAQKYFEYITKDIK